MRFVNPSTLAKDQSLQIGKQGENMATAIDFSDFLAACQAEYGTGTLALSHQRAEDSAPYAVSLDGALWKVTSSDLQYAGTGLCELTYTVGSVVKKSRHWKTNTHTALGQTVTPPAAWQAYIDAVTAKVAEVENMTVSATTLEAGASATVTKSTVGGVVHLTFGLPKGQDGSGGSVTRDDIITALGFTPANSTALSAKQDTISDLPTIRSGAAAGATALQSYTETDPTVPSWAKAQTKPTYQANEIAMGDSTVGAEISDLIEAVAQKQDTLTDSDRQSITKTGMTSGAAWNATEQAAARSRIGAEKAAGDWVLKGTMTMVDSYTVDLTGCTELMIFAYVTATGNVNLNCTHGPLIYNIGASGNRNTYARWADTPLGMGSMVCSYNSNASYTSSNGTVYSYNNNKRIAGITSFSFNTPANVTSCEIKIYAR